MALDPNAQPRFDRFMNDRIDAILAERGLILPRPAAPVADYVPTVAVPGLLFVSGQISFAADGTIITGRVGTDAGAGAGADVDAGKAAAQACALMIVAQLKQALGTLDRVERIVKLNVFVNCTAGFTAQPEVADGASSLMVALFGDAGRHARAAVGVAALPRGAMVEIDAIVAVRPA
jgi:enamine deaminase RidA (YjgF/YER057c/UK114 family)